MWKGIEMDKKDYIEPNLVKIAADQDVFDILSRDGVPMKLTSGVYRHREHDSMVISPGKGFYWFSQGYGSKNPIDYYIKVEGMTFTTAAYHVLEVMNYDFTRKDIVISDSFAANPNYIHGEFSLPEKAENNKNVYAYLTKTRGLNKDIVKSLLDKGLIYQDKKYNNAVFVGKDYDGNIVSAFKRSTRTYGNSNFKSGDEYGSMKEYRFRVENHTNTTVNVFESEIDLLSYLSMLPELARNENYIALGGVSDRALAAFLERNVVIEHINICTDNDVAGHKFCSKIAEELGKDYYITREIPINKDFNEDLTKGLQYERNRIDVIVFDDATKQMTKKEKIKYINEIFSNKYQGMQVELPFPDINAFSDKEKNANINRITNHHFKHMDKIESYKSYKTKLNIGVEKDLVNLIETSTYVGSKEEAKENQNSIHKATEGWHYFNKPLIIDDYICMMIVDIRENSNNDLFVHKIRLKEIEFNLLNRKDGEFSQTLFTRALTREQPPSDIYNNKCDGNKSQDLKKQKKNEDEEFFLSKDEEEFEF